LVGTGVGNEYCNSCLQKIQPIISINVGITTDANTTFRVRVLHFINTRLEVPYDSLP
jgi:hypothetical protein